jgi:beta-lactamase regulating signal transducer with metallopeptidase domain
MQFSGSILLFETLARQAAHVAVSGLWQGLGLTLALALCLKCVPRITASHRFVLWLTGFVAVAALPIVPLGLSSPGSVAFGTPPAASHAWLQLDSRWTFLLAAVWTVVSFVRVADLALHTLRLRRLWLSATPVDVSAVPAKGRRRFQICSTQFLDRPSVIGFFAPRVLIPDWLLPRLSPRELEQIVLHESTHLLRRDDWTNLFQKLCLVLFPLNPALWVIDRWLEKEREMACDEAVIRTTQAPRAYAACLASLAERGLAHRAEALSLGAWQRRTELAQRVQSILHRKQTLPPAAARLLLSTLGCGLLVASFELARCPQLVAFTTPTPANLASASSAQLGDAVYPNNPRRNGFPSGVFAEQAKAVMPEPPVPRPAANRAHSAKTLAVGELRAASSEPGALSSPAPYAVNAKARVPSGSAEAEQFIVLTTWEQVETSTRSPQAVADYDLTASSHSVNANPAAQNSLPRVAAKQSDPNSETDDPAAVPVTGRITVTRLVFRVLSPSSDPNAKGAANPNAKSAQPTFIPFDEGWFVIQL